MKVKEFTALTIQPQQLIWTDKGGQQVIKISNLGATLHALKVKCSDNKTFVINPVFSSVAPGKTAEVVVTRNPAPLKMDKVFRSERRIDKRYFRWFCVTLLAQSRI